MARKFFQLLLRPQDVPKAEEIESKIAAYKAIHRKRTLFEALAEMLEIVEKVEEK